MRNKNKKAMAKTKSKPRRSLKCCMSKGRERLWKWELLSTQSKGCQLSWRMKRCCRLSKKQALRLMIMMMDLPILIPRNSPKKAKRLSMITHLEISRSIIKKMPKENKAMASVISDTSTTTIQSTLRLKTDLVTLVISMISQKKKNQRKMKNNRLKVKWGHQISRRELQREHNLSKLLRRIIKKLRFQRKSRWSIKKMTRSKRTLEILIQKNKKKPTKRMRII